MGIRRLPVWYIMLNRRLLRKWSFVLVLLAAPLMVIAMNALSGGSKGVLRIILCNAAGTEISSQIIDELLGSETVIQYEKAESENAARDMLEHGNADAIWIFDEEIGNVLSEAAASHRVKPVVNVVEREDSIPLMLARERLYSVIYPYYNYQIYVNYVHDEIAGNDITDDALYKTYEGNKAEEKLFRRKYIDGQDAEGNSDYLLAPIRGMLAVWLVLCGLVSCIYYMLDRKNGIFDRVSNRHGVLIELGYHMVIIIIAAVIMMAGLIFSGITTSFINELVCMLAFMYVTAAYCCLVRRLCRTTGIMAVVIPCLIIMMLGLSSAFISLRVFSYFRFLHPVYLYLTAVYSSEKLIEMLVFGTVLNIICYVIDCSHFPHKVNI